MSDVAKLKYFVLAFFAGLEELDFLLGDVTTVRLKHVFPGTAFVRKSTFLGEIAFFVGDIVFLDGDMAVTDGGVFTADFAVVDEVTCGFDTLIEGVLYFDDVDVEEKYR